MSYCHFLSFRTRGKAEEAQAVVTEHIKPLDSYIEEPTDGQTAHVVRFLTEEKVTELQEEIVAILAQPDASEWNRQES